MIIKVKKADQSLFPMEVENMRVELVEDADGNFIMDEETLNWTEFQDKKPHEFWARAKKQKKFKHRAKKYTIDDI